MSITAHTVVRNDDLFVGYAVRSVLDFVDRIIVFDTGSTDNTAAVVESLAAQHPERIDFERKGPSDPARHTTLRQEMLDRTTTDWFMILDGDEVWTKRAMTEATEVMRRRPELEFLIAPYFNCVGDLFHDYIRRGSFPILNRKERLAPRFVRRVPGLRWQGAYGVDMIVNAHGGIAFREDNSVVLNHGFWHMTHLRRSSAEDAVYSSGGSRNDKRRPTYLGIGRRITEPPPEVFSAEFLEANRLPLSSAALNLMKLGRTALRRLRRSGAPQT